MDEIQRLLLKIEGEDKLKSLNVELGKEEDYLKKLLLIQKQGVVGVAPATIDAAAASVVKLNVEIAKTEKATRNFSGSALQLGYVMDDLVNTSGSWERHLSAISNNIPGLAMSLGAGAGLAGTIALISTSLIALAPIAKRAWEALGGEGEGPMKVVKALDMAEERLKRIKTELEKILAGEGAQAAETHKLVSEYLGGGSGKKILGGAAQAIGASGRGAQMTPYETEQAAGYQRTIDDAAKLGLRNPNAEAGLAAIQERINSANVESAGKLVGAAPTEKGARDTLRALGKQFPGAFPAGFAGDLESLEPGADADSDAWEEKTKGWADAGERRREKRADRARRRRITVHRDDATTREQLANEEAVDREHEARKHREEQRLKAKTAEDLANDQAMERAQAQEAHAAPLNSARAHVAEAASGQGVQLNPQQLEAAAHDALRNFHAGMDDQTATYQAILNTVNRINAMGAKFRADSARMMAGSDANGAFSNMGSMP